MKPKALIELDQATRFQSTRTSSQQFTHIQHRADQWLGVEHEFTLHRDFNQVDFRHIISRLDVGLADLDPGDPRARRLSSGALLTADGKEAEIATPPVLVRPGFSTVALRHADRARQDLERGLAQLEADAIPFNIDGYSTHISVQVPDRAVVRTARRFVSHCAPSMMLLLDNPTSPGLLVRPRRGRLELCGDYVGGDQLRAASIFAAATSLSLLQGRAPRRLRLNGTVDPARERYGFYVDRHCYGNDLYREGRRAQLGGSTAQTHLEGCWEWARPQAETIASATELRLVDDIVDGHCPLPVEHRDSHAITRPTNTLSTRPIPAPATVQDPFGSALTPRRVGGVTMAVKVLTWGYVVFELRGLDQTSRSQANVYVSIPGDRLDAFLAAVGSRSLTSVFADLLVIRSELPTLSSVDQTSGINAFSSIAPGAVLTPGERNPLTGKIDGPNGPGSREQKEQSHSQEWPKPQLPTIHPGVLAAVIVAMIMTGLFAMFFLFGGDDQAANTEDDLFDEAMIDEFEAQQLEDDMNWSERDSLEDLDFDDLDAAGLGGAPARCGPLTTAVVDDFFVNGLGVNVDSFMETTVDAGPWIDDPEQTPDGVGGWQRCVIIQLGGVTESGSGLMMFVETFERDAADSAAFQCNNSAWRYANEFIVGCSGDHFVSMYANDALVVEDEEALDAAALILMDTFMQHFGVDSFDYDLGEGWQTASSSATSQGNRTVGGG